MPHVGERDAVVDTHHPQGIYPQAQGWQVYTVCVCLVGGDLKGEK